IRVMNGVHDKVRSALGAACNKAELDSWIAEGAMLDGEAFAALVITSASSRASREGQVPI
ncbi:hypothetical protein, partial [Variovorax sp. GT1P44]|uniref:hypothetical protein n=1 Tax=Variovorax sp. GT1P44 TaxID=3443742 RepID=UPI003F46CB9C